MTETVNMTETVTVQEFRQTFEKTEMMTIQEGRGGFEKTETVTRQEGRDAFERTDTARMTATNTNEFSALYLEAKDHHAQTQEQTSHKEKNIPLPKKLSKASSKSQSIQNSKNSSKRSLHTQGSKHTNTSKPRAHHPAPSRNPLEPPRTPQLTLSMASPSDSKDLITLPPSSAGHQTHRTQIPSLSSLIPIADLSLFPDNSYKTIIAPQNSEAQPSKESLNTLKDLFKVPGQTRSYVGIIKSPGRSDFSRFQSESCINLENFETQTIFEVMEQDLCEKYIYSISLAPVDEGLTKKITIVHGRISQGRFERIWDQFG
jgi:hypothetical protein